jgi:hypothetical protein
MSEGLVARIKRDLEDTRLIVIDTVQHLLERGERLNDLNDRTRVLLEQSERFEARVTKNHRVGVLRGLNGVARGIWWTIRILWTSTLVVLSRFWAFFFVLFPTHQGITVEGYERTIHTTYIHDLYHHVENEEKKIESRQWIGEYDVLVGLKQRKIQDYVGSESRSGR